MRPRIVTAAAILALGAAALGGKLAPVSTPIDQPTQASITPDAALQRLLDGNACYAAGNLTSVMQAIEPAQELIRSVEGEPSSQNARFVTDLTEANVRHTVGRLRSPSELLRKLEADGKLKIVGARYDLSTGKVSLLNQPPAPPQSRPPGAHLPSSGSVFSEPSGPRVRTST